ncbi:MAG TPA: ATP-dependent helicase C-terminal domain-containing protein [Planctomycetaceae bacterium]|nr:ATP-dependent helicase C-terminal domain-containing protein [Planctomycetaceae bacterium]
MSDDPRPPLPIDELLPEIRRALADSPSLVICAPPGAGKTTRVPPALLDPPLAREGRVLVLQPRRMAARAAARRIAAERGVPLGDEIGYQVRFDQRISSRTRLAVVTEGILLRMLHDEPLLESVGAVIFDEFHERNLNSDLALGMTRRIQQTVRPELRIVVMSATLDSAPVAAFLGGCRVVQSSGRMFPVAISYWGSVEKRPLADLVARGIERVLPQTPGDILAFLPGVGEIRQAAAETQSLARKHNLAVFPLYGDLPPEEQDAVLMPSERRKLVLSTNVAETSLTIPGITAVVDSGLARQMRFDPSVGLDRLVLGPISRASADQRAGRAGRTAAGVCLRLWEERTHPHRPAFELPEIERVDLAAAVLQLWSWGETDVMSFPWFERPSQSSVDAALALLERLEAIEDHRLTPLGQTLARLPVHPRIARLLVEGNQRDCLSEAALAAAMLSERDPFVRSAASAPSGPRVGTPRTAARSVSRSDVLDRVVSFEEYETHGRTETAFGPINPGAAAFIGRARDQLVAEVREQLGDRQGRADRPQSGRPQPDALLRALLAAFPDRVARRRDSSTGKGVMVGGRGVRLAPQSAVTEAELFVCVDVDAGQTEAIVRQASAVERDWLPARRLRTADEVFFHPTQKSVVGRRRTYWDDLLLDEVNIPAPTGEKTATILAEAAWREWERVFPTDDPTVSSFLARVRCLAAWMPELKLPDFDEAQLRAVLLELCQACRSFDELRRAPWLDLLKARLTYAQREALEREAPERIAVPSGSRIAIAYEVGRPPALAVRIQEVFGLRQTPRIAAGRVAVVMHLLAPNMRTQQITDDLESFWANGYPRVRKDLRARYPKHPWPEDPWTAEPTRRTKRSPKKQ